MELSAASAAVAKVVAMDNKGKTLERVEPIMSNLEKLFDNYPNFETVYRGRSVSRQSRDKLSRS